MIEEFSKYEYEIFHKLVYVWNFKGKTKKTEDWFTYKIYGNKCSFDNAVIHSNGWYDTYQEAKICAIKHIIRLKNGEK